MAFDAKGFLEALHEIEVSKGISRETVIVALQDAMTRAFRKELGGDDALVRVVIEPENNLFEMYHMKKIVENVEDDFLEITKEEAFDLAKEGKGYVEGDEYVVPATIEQMRKATALSVKSMMKQKFAEAEKSLLNEAFKDKVNTMVTGRVEKVDDHGVSVIIGRNSVYLPKNQLIGDERFNVNDPIKLYINSIEGGKGGARIVVSRTNEGFLKCLFEEEIREVFDGTIEIKGLAREAGERSKIAVYAKDPNVDPAGACIGPNGSRIQKVVVHLGNGQAREKIDVIAYSYDPRLFIMEALKPAKSVGIIFDAQNKKAVVVVKDDSLSLAIGRHGINASLAVKLTGYKIDIKTKSQADELGLVYESYDEIQLLDIEERRRKYMEINAPTPELYAIPEGYVAPQERVYDDEDEERNEALNAQVDAEEVTAMGRVETPVEETPVEVAPAPVEEEAPVVEVAPVEETPVVEEKVEVKTTTSLEDLEKSLSKDANKGQGDYKRKSYKNKNNKSEEDDEEKAVTPTQTGTRMAIYTDEELAALEDEENEEEVYDDEDVDYDQYDDYYDK